MTPRSNGQDPQDPAAARTSRAGHLIAEQRGNLPHALAALTLSLLCAAFWGLLHDFRGIFHDASLYTLQALGRLQPTSLSQDVFLKLGSQDDFTLFSPLYASVIRVLGAEWAAALLTLVSQCALFVGAWLLARAALAESPATGALFGARHGDSAPATGSYPVEGSSIPSGSPVHSPVASPTLARSPANPPEASTAPPGSPVHSPAQRLALFGVAVLIALPGNYGSGRIFACVEPFLTPRMGAEALVLGSLAAAMRGHARTALGILLLAGLIHPIMAAAGAAALFCLYVLLPRPRVGAAIMGVMALAAALLAAAHEADWMFIAPSWGSFDAVWLHLVRDRSPYLFLSNWTTDDWGRIAVTLATLAVGAARLPGERARRLCQALLLTSAGGLLLSFVASDELRLVWVTQLQPWRWQWLAVATAALLLPAILETCAASDAAGHIAALLLVAAWIFGANAFSLWPAVAAVAALGLAPRLGIHESRWLFYGSLCMLAIAVIWRIASNLAFTDATYMEPSIPLWQRRAVSFTTDGSAALCILALTWWFMRTPRGRAGLLTLALLAAVANLVLLPHTWRQWTYREFTPQRVAEFASWRQAIPAGAQVFWPESPLSAWLLLERPSYLSPTQTSGMVYSRAAALELQGRALSMQSVVPPAAFLGWDSGGPALRLSRQQLQDACRLGVFDYLVTRAALELTPVAVSPNPSHLRLYHCAARPADGTPQARAVAAAT